MKKILSFLTGLLMIIFSLAAISSTKAQDSTLPFDTIPVSSMGFSMVLSPDNQTIAIYDHYLFFNDDAPPADMLSIRLIDTTTHEVAGTLSGFTDWVTGLSFSADSQTVISMHRNGDLILWDVPNRSMIKTIPTFKIGGSPVQLLKDGQTVVFLINEFVVALLDTETGNITRLLGQHINTYHEFVNDLAQYPGRGDIAVASIATSADGHWMATASQNDQVTLLNMESQEQWVLREKSEKFALFSIRPLVFSPDGSQLIYFDQSTKQTHWWDVNTHKEIRVVDFGTSSFGVAPDLTTLAWADRETKAIYILDTATSNEPVQIMTLPETLDVAQTVTALVFSADGKQLYIGGLYAQDTKNAIYVVHLSTK